MHCSFKDGKNVLLSKEVNYNFILSSTRMCVERASRILKGRWRLTMKKYEKLQVGFLLACSMIMRS